MSAAALIFPHQLFAHHPALAKTHGAWLHEHARFFTDFKFHKQKLIFHRASMKSYAAQLSHKMSVRYADCKTFPTLATVLRDIKKHGHKEVHVANATDNALERELQKACKKANLKLVVHESPMFLLGSKEVATMLGEASSAKASESHVSMAAFYIKMRRKFRVLIDAKGNPLGGQWSLDAENRKRLPKSAPIPELKYPNRCETVGEAFTYVEKLFRRNPGHTEGYIYPVTHADARAWLEDFLRHRLAEFGDYEDAIAHNEHTLFHSMLSPLLNSGLLTPKEVIESTLHHARRHPIRLNCLEGFIRQILGWREFVRGVYITRGEIQRTTNFWKFKRKLPKAFIHGTTGVLPIDTTITKVLETAYSHHIERLMVLGNFLLLSEIHPDQVYGWFMENFIDAYDWVMVPNVYGMSQYADGGLMTTKPYIASSNYIRNMSDYPGGEWEKTFDALFWRFLSVHSAALQKNPRLAALFEQMRKSSTQLQKHKEIADAFLKGMK